jgi:hypothetical protein
LVRIAAIAASSSAQSSHFEPLRVLPERRLPGGLVVAGAHPGPGGELLVGREHAHVNADLGDDHLGGAPLNSGDRAQQLNGLLERGDLLPDRLGQTGDLPVQEVDVLEDRADPHGVQVIKAPLQRLLQSGDLGAHPAAGELGEDLRVPGAVHERIEHRPTRLPENV